ncbi:MAG TPA: hypothetical protein VE954_24685 [Oligoflexus sp.]|nr:hypothetical protein [Oligoflexus sp.]
MKLVLRFFLHLSVAGTVLPGFACSKDKSEDVVCEEMISDINSAVSEHFLGLSIFECTNASECSTSTWETSCNRGCDGLVLTCKKDELAAFLGGSEVGGICDRYQKKGCGRIEDDCPG